MKVNLNVKVEEFTRNEIVRLASEEGITPSEYARNILNDYVDYLEEDRSDLNHLETVVIPTNSQFQSDKELILLLNWLYAKAIFPTSNETREFISEMKMILERAMTNYKFGNELRFEFLKVLNDVNRYLLEPDDTYKQFHFCHQGNLYAFNYSLLISEVWRVAKID